MATDTESERLEAVSDLVAAVEAGQDGRRELERIFDILDSGGLPAGVTLAYCEQCGRETAHAGQVCGRQATWPEWWAALQAERGKQ